MGQIKSIYLLESESRVISKDLKVKSYQLKDLKQHIPYKNQEGYSKYIKVWQAKRGYFKFLGSEHLKYRLRAKRAALKPKIGIL